MATYQLPVGVKVEVTNRAQVMKELHKNLQEAFSSVKMDSTFGGKIEKLNTDIGKAFTKIDTILGKGIFDEADFKKVNQLMNKITDFYSEMNLRASRATPEMLGVNPKELEQVRQTLADLQKARKEKLGSTNVASALKGDIATFKEFAKLSDKTGFSGGRSFEVNINKMTAKLGELRQQYVDLDEQEKTAAENRAKYWDSSGNLIEKAARDQQEVQLKAQREAYQKGFQTQELAKAFAARPGLFKKKDEVLGGYQEVFKEFITDKDIAEGRQFAQIIGEWMEIDQGTLDTFASQSAEQIIATLNRKLTEKMALPVGSGRMLYTGLFEKAKATQKQQTTTYTQQGLQDIELKYQAQVSDNENYIKEAQASAQAVENINSIKQLIAETERQIQRLVELRNQFTQDIDEQIAEAQKQIAGLEEAGERNKAQFIEDTSGAVSRSSVLTGASQQQYEQEVEARRVAEANQKEADTFKSNLQSSIKQWMSVREIIGLIKAGIREAYQDIQGLDKAMTNIAVVTDFSVSDLWDKINEYMAVAQQYGVTTQGVYEVSQLYYQQGLGEAETMELTTETLKMARIAGMGYSEAADGMTVALRGFNMEMSEAARVTDVYSKVAA